MLACLDELEDRIRAVFALSVVAAPQDALVAMGAGLRALLADGVIAGFWLQASAAARADEVIAERFRVLIAHLLAEGERLTERDRRSWPGPSVEVRRSCCSKPTAAT